MGFIIYVRASIVSINKLALMSLAPESHMDCSMGPEGGLRTQWVTLQERNTELRESASLLY